MKVRSAAAALVVVGAIVSTAAAATFTDPVGDVIVVPAGATITGLDISAIEVTNEIGGPIRFRVTLDGAPAFPLLSGVVIVLDLDEDVTTGEEGIEALVGYGPDDLGTPEIVYAKYNALAKELLDAPVDALTATYLNGVVEITAPRSELFNTSGFVFQAVSVVTTADESQFAGDIAPTEPTTYKVVGAPPREPPKLVATPPTGTPARPKAGKRFVVRSLVTRDDTKLLVTSGRVTCEARIGGARLKASGRLGNVAQCAMTVPKNAKGKTLRGTMTIRALGGNVKRSFSFGVT